MYELFARKYGNYTVKNVRVHDIHPITSSIRTSLQQAKENISEPCPTLCSLKRTNCFR